jgi:Phage tail protein (Tail_P2_I)
MYDPETIVGEQLREATSQLAPDDDQHSDAHAKLCDALGMPFEQLAELLSPPDPYPPWGPLFDVNICPAWALPWLAQVVGLNLPIGLSEADSRTFIKDISSHKRGTKASMQAVLNFYLTGTKTAYVRERDPDAADPAYSMEIVTLNDEIPPSDLAGTTTLVKDALMALKPAGIVLNYNSVPAWDWQQVHTDYATWDAASAPYSTWDKFAGKQTG